MQGLVAIALIAHNLTVAAVAGQINCGLRVVIALRNGLLECLSYLFLVLSLVCLIGGLHQNAKTARLPASDGNRAVLFYFGFGLCFSIYGIR